MKARVCLKYFVNDCNPTLALCFRRKKKNDIPFSIGVES